MAGLPGVGRREFSLWQACPDLAGRNLVCGGFARIGQAGIWFAAGLPGLNKRKMLQGKRDLPPQQEEEDREVQIEGRQSMAMMMMMMD